MGKLHIASLFALLSFGCGNDPCQPAVDMIRQCGAQRLADSFASQCTAEVANKVLASSCDQIAMLEQGAKADGFLGLFFGRSEGHSCSYNFQCSGDLVCRPDDPSLPNQLFCFPPNRPDGLCKKDSDCQSGLYCATDTFTCVVPGGEFRICNSDSDCPHDHPHCEFFSLEGMICTN